MAYQCKQCMDRFLRKSMLDRHTCRSASDSHKCGKCGGCFNSAELLLKHDCGDKSKQCEPKSGPPLVKCQHCGAQFTNENTLKVHIRIHTGDMPYKCQQCGLKFPYHSNLRSHLRVHNDPIDRPHKCDQCGAKFSQYANLQAHLRTHATDRTTTCNKCKGIIPENCTHVCPEEGGDPFFKCVECGARFTVKNTLEVHMRTHTGEKPYKCNQCNERFIQAGALQSHLRTHTLQLNHECGECGQRYATEEKLRDHVRTHAQFILHKCTVCQAAFANESRLQLHMEQKHVPGEKRFNCNRCSQSFSTESEFQIHSRSAHSESEVRTHHCLKCSSVFTTFMLLQNHMRDRHQSSTSSYQNAGYRCDDCGCKYTTQNRLIAHRRVKHPEKSKMMRKPEDSGSTALSQNSTPKPSTDNNQPQCNSAEKNDGKNVSVMLSEDHEKQGQINSPSENVDKTENKLSPKTKPKDNVLMSREGSSDSNNQQQKECADENDVQKHTETRAEDHEKMKQRDSPLQNIDKIEQPPNSTPADKQLKRKIVDSEKVPTKKSVLSARNKFKCKECEEVFETHYLLHIHEQGHKYEKGCDKCGVRCTCQSMRTSKRGRKPGTYKCMHCKRKFVGRRLLSEHRCKYSIVDRHHHRNHTHTVQRLSKDTVHESVSSNIKMQKCPECDKSFARKLLLQLHLRNVHAKSSQDCTICNKLCLSKVSEAAVPTVLKEDEGVFICDECKKSRTVDDICSTSMQEEKTVSRNENEETKESLEPEIKATHTPIIIKEEKEVLSNSYGTYVLSQDTVSNEPITRSEGEISESNLDDGNNTIDSIIDDIIENDEDFDNIWDANVMENPKCANQDEGEDDDDADDTKGVHIITVTNEVGEPSCTSVSSTTSRLSILVPKLIKFLTLNVDDAKLEDFGYPTASAVELLERVIVHYDGTPEKNLDTDDEILAANCRVLFALSVGSEEAESLIGGRTIEEVLETTIAGAEETTGHQL